MHVRVLHLRGETKRFTSKPLKDNQSCLHDEERLVSEQTSKGTVEALVR
jgi:hypothetical protein